ncbi:Fibrinogen-like protein A,Ryncolin-4,Ficolin-3,Ficolin-1-B,Ficolin-2,Ryncolin-1,Tenascin-R,Tenascin-X,Tenascin-N,Ryncolin-3,Tenascin,Techylectin-like protein,Fibrinogen C domain-containing protein 1,Ryncolin-2,Angiopoietin-related protein 6,Techylectin-5B,Angiopoietin-related protein 2,Angiopoietin-2,Microfibril-associated glycoprotein 4,Fibrinogen alpha chain,Ficolin-1-A,Ficolin-1,Fibrinogen C domain-containing protein 1-B,Angiopoietin-4 [Mytilus coruscus]|uniref:Fibrinogen C-terminal domain-containing protein n=1 Tax=Mytilus coruscus TaxID=42192 RepID=A0A6J8BZV4_MYTCO|nr:Fibrinogen-like protein A,Ryncolin-4,Ficolin-3,Ficolin-1-B,Ficolin-2,Ryncolin-1,Tenascin-R,Tenascin-X,Tenascin-N,Ryncolin-3,Tenascin,Techylectin-like protein,Fibrinogen C domain-containing protein 1,Ryncolin-2,Angiopoietin-related protein 6,Techylectin-5B,Angiopoietin-related protein 2,Angiopoietin-2,Microfibril-associated glycoprotein 4,Fibrinogen alpha chain,Ficolin-1-A,Ficolin-1,Fibrinogen C domain-containing protein 1-B,Angiopoietin-4 [Mytilus coruscus]
MFKIFIFGFTLFVLASTTKSNSSKDVEVRLLDNQNAPLDATLDMSKADERIKQFLSDAVEVKMKNIEETVKSKQFLSDALKAIKIVQEVSLKSQIANLERNLTDQLTDYIDDKVGKIDEENEKPEDHKQRPIDCGAVKTRKGNGVYKIFPKHSELGFDVYCDFETDNGGWTVFQRRLNGETDFYRGWETYENGFGNLEAEFWLGNQRIHTLTAQGKSELRVDISDFNGNIAYAKYSTFSIGDASTNYKLTVTGYSGNAGDSLRYHNGQDFTTKDKDNDPSSLNCAIIRQGAWWYNTCDYCNLNGLYTEGGKTIEKGITWYYWKNLDYSMKSSSMMLRRL